MWRCEKCGEEMPEQFDACTTCRDPLQPVIHIESPVCSWLSVICGCLALIVFWVLSGMAGDGFRATAIGLVVLLIVLGVYVAGILMALIALFRGEGPIWVIKLGLTLNLLPPIYFFLKMNLS